MKLKNINFSQTPFSILHNIIIRSHVTIWQFYEDKNVLHATMFYIECKSILRLTTKFEKNPLVFISLYATFFFLESLWFMDVLITYPTAYILQRYVDLIVSRFSRYFHSQDVWYWNKTWWRTKRIICEFFNIV